MASILLFLFLIKAINAWYRHRHASLSWQHDIDIDVHLYHGTDIDLIRSVCFAIVQVEMLNISRLADGNFCLTLETYRLGPLIIGDGCS